MTRLILLTIALACFALESFGAPPASREGAGAPGLPAFLSPPPMGPHPGMGMMAPPFNVKALEAMMANMGIDKGVSAKIVAESRLCIKTLEEKHIALMRADLDIREELVKDKPDLRIIAPFVDKKMKVLGDIELCQLKRDIAIKALLSPEQFELWKEEFIRKMLPRDHRGPRDPGKGRSENNLPPPPLR